MRKNEKIAPIPDPPFDSPGPLRLSPTVLLRYGLLLAVVMMGIAWLWAQAVVGDPMSRWFPRDQAVPDLAFGSVVGVCFALGVWLLLDRIPALRRVSAIITSTLDMGALRYHHALMFGLMAGIPEELLFRGALQPTFGLMAASLLFGVLHGITFAYAIYAACAGLLLGGLAIWTGGLWAPITAHTLIDLTLFALLIRSWRRAHPAY